MVVKAYQNFQLNIGEYGSSKRYKNHASHSRKKSFKKHFGQKILAHLEFVFFNEKSMPMAVDVVELCCGKKWAYPQLVVSLTCVLQSIEKLYFIKIEYFDFNKK